MFQKDGTASNSKNAKKQDVTLRKSEKRKLRERIYDTFPHLFTSPSSAFDDDDDDNVKPSNDVEESYKQNQVLLDDILAFGGGGGDFIVRKLRLPNIPTMMLYLRTPNSSNGSSNKNNHQNEESVGGWPYHSTTQPIILDMEVENRKMMLIPCLAFLSIFPSALPQIVVPSQVSKYLCRGADLMKSGVLGLNNNTRETEVYRGDVVSIAVRGNPQPFGIGFMTGDATPMEVGCGTKGVAVKMITCYGDDLYRIQLPVRNANGSSSSRNIDDGVDVVDYDDGNFGNVGFIDGALVRPVLQNEGMDSTDDEEEDEEGSDDTEDGEGQTVNITDSPSEAVDNMTKDMTNTAITNDDAPPTEEEEDNDPDALLLYTFYKALNTTVKDTLLPMPVSIFYGGHLLPARPKNTTLEIKQTTYKKIGPFLQKQANEGIISLSPSSDGRDKTAFLSVVHRSHPDLRLAKKELKKESPSSSASSSSTTATNTGDSKRKVAIVNLMCIPSQIATTLNLPKDAVSASNAKSEARKNTGFLTGSECRAIFLDYIQTNDLVDPMDPSMVILDGPICDALFKPTKKEIKAGITVTYPIACTRKEIQERWTKKMEKAYAVVAMPGNQVLSIQRGRPSEVLIEVEKRQGNKKYNTRVRGLEEYGINGALFANDVAKRFACASTVETNPEGRAALKKGNVELVFQGHLLEELKALLTGDTNLSSHGGSKGGEYCIPKGVIVENLRRGVVKKKKK